MYNLDADEGLKLAVDIDGDSMVVARGPTNEAKVYRYTSAEAGWQCAAVLKGGIAHPLGHTRSVMAAAISGERVVTAGKDGVVKVWWVDLKASPNHSEL